MRADGAAGPHSSSSPAEPGKAKRDNKFNGTAGEAGARPATHPLHSTPEAERDPAMRRTCPPRSVT